MMLFWGGGVAAEDRNCGLFFSLDVHRVFIFHNKTKICSDYFANGMD